MHLEQAENGKTAVWLIHEEISIMDYHGAGGHHGLSLTVNDPGLS